MSQFTKEKIPSIEIGLEEDTQEEQTITFEWWKLYLLISVIFISFSIISYNAYTINSESKKINNMIEQQKVSTGAKIESLMNKIAENKLNWKKEEKQIEVSTINQDKLNENTTKLEEELTKYNISLIK